MGGSIVGTITCACPLRRECTSAAHVGVLKALSKYHLEPDLVVGTSGEQLSQLFMPQAALHRS